MRSLQIGYACMALAAALPDRLLPVHKGHEILAVLAFAGVSYGMARIWQRCVVKQMTPGDDRRRSLAGLVAGIVMLPIVLAAGVQAYLFLERPDLPWVNLTWRARGVPVQMSFAFWEWLTCLVLSGYMTMLALLHVPSVRCDAPGKATVGRI